MEKAERRQEVRSQHDSYWNRDFAFAFAGYFFLFMSVSVFFLLPLFLDQFHPSKSRVGVIMGIHSVTAILVRPFLGRIVDERGGRKMAVLGTLGMIAVMPGFYLVRDAGLLVLLLRAAMGAAWGVAMTATIAACSDLAPLDRLAHSIGIIGVGGILAGAAGPVLAEELARRYGFGALFTASLVFLVAGLLCMAATREVPRPDIGTALRQGLRLGEHTPWTLAIVAAMPTVHGAIRGAVVNFVALFASSAGFGRVGPFFVAFSAAAVLTRFGIGDISDRYGRKRVIFPTAILIGLNLFWIASAGNYGVFLLNGFIAGLGQGLIFPALSTYLIDFLGRENKGLALGLYMSLFDLGMGLGSPVFGWFSDLGGYRMMYAAAGVALLITSVAFHTKAPWLGITAATAASSTDEA
jgi:MFS family permease